MIWFMIMFFLFVLLPMTRSYVKLPKMQTTESKPNSTGGTMEVENAAERQRESGAARQVETTAGNPVTNDDNNLLSGSGRSDGGGGGGK